MHIPAVAILIAAFSVAESYTPDIVELLNTETTRWNGWIKNTGKYDGWRTQNIPPNGQLVYGLCAMQGGSRDNWLRSPYIRRKEALSTKVEITFTMRSCKTSPRQGFNCEDTLSLMIYESDDPVDVPGLWNDRIYSTVAVVSPDIRWTDPREENILNVKTYSMEPKRAGFFISLHDVGACAMVKRIRVFYLACAAIIRLFTHYPRTVVNHEYRIRDVKSHCVPGAELIDLKKLPHLLCQPNGYWHYLDTPFCHCKTGFTPSEDNTFCLKCPINTYKTSTGSGRCLNCPSNSFSESGSDKCTCNNTLVPVESSDGKLSCSGSLPSPQYLKASFTPDGQLQLEWSKPQSPHFIKALSSELHFKVACQSCEESEKLHYFPGTVTTHRSVLIDALESGKTYNFSVTSLNYINQMIKSSNLSSSSAIISVITKHADQSYQIRKLVIRKIKGKYSLLVSWSSPTDVSPINYQVVIHGIAINPGISKPVILDPILKISKTLQCEFPYLMNLVFAYRIKVRARSITDWGPFSVEQEVNLSHMTDNSLGESELDESKKDMLSPGRLSMISIFGMGLILMLIAIPLCFYCRYVASKSFGIHSKKNFNRTLSIPLDIANYSQIPTGSNATRIYIDPSHYQDPSTLIKEFTHEIDPGKVNIECVIGEGEFGEVCKGRLSKRGNPSRISVAIKTLKSNLSEKERMNFFIEAATMAQFNHPNIIKLVGVVTKTQPIMILTQFIEYGSLDVFLQKNKYQFSTLQLLGMLRGIASGMKYLSDMHYVHRDLAARNILVDKDLCCKVSDFGLSREIGADTTEGAYTTTGGLIPVRWTAPEAINYRRFTSSSDVWSFGIVMWEVMSYGERPYWDWANKDVLQSIEAGYRLPAPKGCPPPIHLLMLDCWMYERAGRPKFPQILHSIDALQLYPESLSTLPFSLSLKRSIPLDLNKSHQSIISVSKNDNENSKLLLQPNPVFSSQSTITEWLEWLDLDCYQNMFSKRNLVFLGQIIKFTRKELLSLDISDSDHLHKIVTNLEAMQNHFEDVQTPSFAS